MQRQQIWKERFLNKEISWRGTLQNCTEYEEQNLILISVDVPSGGGCVVWLFLEWPLSRRATALSFKLGERVLVKGAIKDKFEEHLENRICISIRNGEVVRC
jgi:hypothetical protein